MLHNLHGGVILGVGGEVAVGGACDDGVPGEVGANGALHVDRGVGGIVVGAARDGAGGGDEGVLRVGDIQGNCWVWEGGGCWLSTGVCKGVREGEGLSWKLRWDACFGGCCSNFSSSSGPAGEIFFPATRWAASPPCTAWWGSCPLSSLCRFMPVKIGASFLDFVPEAASPPRRGR